VLGSALGKAVPLGKSWVLRLGRRWGAGPALGDALVHCSVTNSSRYREEPTLTGRSASQTGRQ
jgi:hypothetical protein